MMWHDDSGFSRVDTERELKRSFDRANRAILLLVAICALGLVLWW